MKKLFCVIGLSGSGKSTITNYTMKLLKEDKYKGLSRLVYHTTRPPRSGEKEGVDYHFIDKNTYKEEYYSDDIIEIRSYNMANNGLVYYFTTFDDIFGSNDNLICIPSIEQLKNYIDFQKENKIPQYKFEVYVIHIICDMRKRFMRCLESRVENDNDFLELCRRNIQENEDWKIAEDMISELDENHYYKLDNNHSGLFTMNAGKLVKWIKDANGYR